MYSQTTPASTIISPKTFRHPQAGTAAGRPSQPQATAGIALNAPRQFHSPGVAFNTSAAPNPQAGMVSKPQPQMTFGFLAPSTFGLPLPTLTSGAWWVLSMSNNLGFTARDFTRVQTVPHTRKADFMQRNYFMSLVTPCVMESAFRLVDTYYTMPLMAKALGLHELGYKTLPEEVRRRSVGSLVKQESVYLIPRVLKDVDLPAAKTPEERERLETLIRHLQKKLNFADYMHTLADDGQLPLKEAEQVIEHTRKLRDEMKQQKNTLEITAEKLFQLDKDGRLEILQTLKNKTTEPIPVTDLLNELEKLCDMRGKERKIGTRAFLAHAEKAFTQKHLAALKDLSPCLARELMQDLERVGGMGRFARKKGLAELVTRWEGRFMEKHLEKIGQEVWHDHPLRDKLVGFVRQGFESEFTRNMIKRIQTTMTWPKMLASTGLCFLSYGIMSNFLDVKVIQPWQDKLVAKRGTAQEVVAPCYLATLPYLGVLVAGLWDRLSPAFLKRLPYLTRFVTVAGAAIAAYIVTAAILIRKKLSGPAPKLVPQERKAAPQWQPQQVANTSTIPLSPAIPTAVRAVEPQQARFQAQPAYAPVTSNIQTTSALPSNSSPAAVPGLPLTQQAFSTATASATQRFNTRMAGQD